MQLTPDQVKGRIKSVAQKNKADARKLMRIYMMERFLERVSVSKYKDNFVIKGGMLVTAMVGVALRSTMDIDTSLKNQNLSAEDAQRIISEIKDTDIGDGVTFEIKEVSNIMDEMEYPGIRFTMNPLSSSMGTAFTGMAVPEFQAGQLAMAGGGAVSNSHTVNMGGLSVVVNGYEAQSDDDLADTIVRRINEMLGEDGAVWGR